MQFHLIQRFFSYKFRSSVPKMGGNWDPDISISMWYTEIRGTEKVAARCPGHRPVWEEERSKCFLQLFYSEKPEKSPFKKNSEPCMLNSNGHTLLQLFRWHEEVIMYILKRDFIGCPFVPSCILGVWERKAWTLRQRFTCQLNRTEMTFLMTNLQSFSHKNKELIGLNINLNAFMLLSNEAWPWTRRPELSISGHLS